MVRSRLRLAALLVALALACSSCSAWLWALGGYGAAMATGGVLANSRFNHLYQRRYFSPGLRPIDASDPGSPLIGNVEFDDYGWYRDRGQPRELLQQLQRMSARENLVVVLYAHGWRHNDSQTDSDQQSFYRTLAFIQSQSDSAPFVAARRAFTSSGNARVVGIAVGWRGQAWPETERWLPGGQILDVPVYFTSFSRKNAAKTVGENDLQDFVSTLADLHAARWSALRDSTGPMMSLVMVGHSFGGHALFSAVRERIESNLSEAIVGVNVKHAEGLGGHAVPVRPEVDNLAKGAAAPPADTCRRLVHGMGDLVMLINPAVEAASYRTIDALVHSARFRRDQPPVLATFTADNDGARGIFGMLRTITNIGRSSLSSHQSRMECTSLGAYDLMITNRLALIDDGSAARKAAKQKIGPQPRSDPAAEAAPGETAEWSAEEAQNKDLSTSFENPKLNCRLAPFEHAVAHSPAILVRTSSSITDGHSDFFRQEFVNWLSAYVLEIQGQRLIEIQKARDARERRARGAVPLAAEAD